MRYVESALVVLLACVFIVVGSSERFDARYSGKVWKNLTRGARKLKHEHNDFAYVERLQSKRRRLRKDLGDEDDDENEPIDYDFDFYSNSDSYSSYSSEDTDIPASIFCSCHLRNGKDACPLDMVGYEVLDELFSGAKKNLEFVSCFDENLDKLNGTETGYVIPKSIGSLKYLEYLELNINLEGDLPEELFELPRLKDLHIKAPLLNGATLERIPSIRQLRRLSLDGSFTGQLPASLGSKVELEELEILSPYITGFIPEEIGQLHELYNIHLGGKFVGELPRSLGRLPYLELLRIRGPPRLLPLERAGKRGEWGLEGPFPSWLIEDVPTLEALVVTNQRLSGVLPTGLKGLSRLWGLNLEDNLLEGAIPLDFAESLNKSVLTNIGLGFNRFTGDFPSWIWSNFPKLSHVRMGGNSFDAHTLPAEFKLTSLRHVDVERSNAVGYIPKDLKKLKSLNELYMGHNALIGRVPRVARMLEVLSVQNNQLTGFEGPIKRPEWATMVVNVAGNPLVCDCSLLDWFGDLFGGNKKLVVLQDEDNTRCSDANEYEGLNVILLRSSVSAPCAHPRRVAVVSVDKDQAVLEWGIGEGEATQSGIQSILDNGIIERNQFGYVLFTNVSEPPSSDKLCWDCSTVNVAFNDSNLPVSAFANAASLFELSWTNSSGHAGSMCCSLSAMYKRNKVVGPISQFNLTNLFPYSDYEVSVRLGFAYFDQVSLGYRHSRFSFGPFSRAVELRTSADIPGSPPQRIQPTVVQDNVVLLQWQPPASSNGEIVGYTVMVTKTFNRTSVPRDIESPSAMAGQVVTLPSNNSNSTEPLPPIREGDEVFYITKTNYLRLSGLEANTQYGFRIQAENTVGTGPLSPTETYVRTKPACEPGSEKIVFQDEEMGCALCKKGFYKDSKLAACAPCPDNVPVTLRNGATSVDDCAPGPGYFKDLTSKEAKISAVSKRCEKGMKCNRPGITSQTLSLEKGYWRESSDTLRIIECTEEEYCQQTSSVNGSYCTANHTGVQCLACEQGFAIKERGGVCELCTDDDLSGDQTAIIGWLILLAIILMAGILRVLFRARKAYYQDLANAEAFATQQQEQNQKEPANASSFNELPKIKSESAAGAAAGAAAAAVGAAAAVDKSSAVSLSSSAVMPSPRNAQHLQQQQQPPHVCFCHGCNKPLTDQGIRTLTNPANNSSDSGEMFWHNQCMVQALQTKPMEQCTLQIVQVVEPPALLSPNLSETAALSNHCSSNGLPLSSSSPAAPTSAAQQKPNWKVSLSQRLSDIGDILDEAVFVKVRIFLGFLQVYIAYYAAFQAPALDITGDISGLESIVNFDASAMLEVIRVRCAWNYQHYDSLLMYTIIPLIFLLLVCCIYKLVRHFYRRCAPAVLSAKTEAWTIVLFLAFMIFPGLSRKIFLTFLCETFPTADGVNVPKNALSSDPRVSCDSPDRTFWLTYAAVMVFVYVFGILAMYSLLLWGIRKIHDQKISNLSPEDQHKLDRIHFLLKPYASRAYWFEAYELVRKSLQTLPILFIVNSSGSTQVGIFVCQLLTFAAILVLLRLKPYKRANDGHLAVLSQVVLLNACICALLESITAYDVVDYNGFDFSAMVAAFFFLEVIAFLAFCVIDLRQALCRRRAASASEKKTDETHALLDDDDDDDQSESNDGHDDDLASRSSFSTGPKPLLITTTFEQSQARQQTIGVIEDETRSPERTTAPTFPVEVL